MCKLIIFLFFNQRNFIALRRHCDIGQNALATDVSQPADWTGRINDDKSVGHTCLYHHPAKRAHLSSPQTLECVLAVRTDLCICGPHLISSHPGC